nr:hypothetical protein [Helicobacter sp. 11-8110]
MTSLSKAFSLPEILCLRKILANSWYLPSSLSSLRFSKVGVVCRIL